MIPWIDIASLAISAVSGASAALRQIVQKYPSLSDRMQALYADALKSWSPNKEVRKHWIAELPTVESFASYFPTAQTIDPEINSLLKIFCCRFQLIHVEAVPRVLFNAVTVKVYH